MAATRKNIIGPALRGARRARKVSQAMLSARCTTMGWDISENTITKIETGIRCVTDQEVVFLARALRVKMSELFPGHAGLF